MINKETHLKRIQEAINELLELHQRTKAPNMVANQYIGTIADNTVSLLTASANSLDNGKRTVTFSDENNWVSLMQAVHRSFLSSLHTAIEVSLEKILECQKQQVENKQQISLKKKLETFKPLPTELEEFIIGIINGIPLNFQDKLNSVLEQTSLTNKHKTIWRKFFNGMTIVRNKVSHSNPTLTQTEQDILIQGGLKVLISKKGDIQVNPRMYKQFAEFTLNFFDLVYKSMK